MSEPKRYASVAAFESALREKLRTRLTPGHTFEDLRKQVAFDRVLARLYAVAPEAWLLKGGVALEYRIMRARATKDIDISAGLDLDGMTDVLAQAASVELDDYFQIRIGDRERPVEEDGVETYRFYIAVEYANGKRFTELKIDVGFSDPWIGTPEVLQAPAFLDFAGIAPTTVRLIPAMQHMAEKLHAYTKMHGTHPSSRVKDLIDMALLLREDFDIEELRSILRIVFEDRATHALPEVLPPPPEAWRVPYAKLAIGLPVPPDLDGGYQFVAAALVPALR